ncbi:Peptidyl-prolyl cis-trans isomerase FKBP17-2, chloroplastic-like protein [Drosera capensis]
MASFGVSPRFLTHPSLPKPIHCSSNPQQQPPPSPPEQLTPQPTTTTPIIKAGTGVSSSARKSTADSTDWVASTLTRRFGLGAGLAWVGFLAVGVVSEQIKTRLEVSKEQANTRDLEEEQEVVLPNGIRYYETRVGGGESPRQGDLVVLNLKGSVRETGQVFVDTLSGEKKRPLALVMGSRPYTMGMCEGIDYVLRTMKSGGKRRVIVPPSFGFGDKGADFGSGVQIPPSATLEYVVEVLKVSIAPA